MRIELNLSSQNLLLLFILILIIAIILCIGSFIIISRKNRFNSECQDNITCKDDILNEFRQIRHEYNNMLQSLICFIEAEEWDGLEEYKDIVLAKTNLLNKNNVTQLVKIKDIDILRAVYKLLIKAKEAGITLNLNIYNEIEAISTYKTECSKVINHYLNNAYEVAIKEAGEVNLKISSNDQGLRFAFENMFCIKPDNLIVKPDRPKRKFKTCKNIFFNTFIQNDNRLQEILITFIN